MDEYAENLIRDLIEELRLVRHELVKLNQANGLTKVPNKHDLKKSIESACKEVAVPDYYFENIKDYKLSQPDKTKAELSVQTINALSRAGIYKLGDLTFCSESDIKKVRLIGKRAFEELQQFMRNHGLEFSEESGMHPLFKLEEHVAFLDNSSRSLKKYTPLVVDSIHPNVELKAYRYHFWLPTYTCHIIDGNNVKTSFHLSSCQLVSIESLYSTGGSV